MKATFAKTRWPDAPMVLIAANPAAGPPVGLPELVSRLQERTHPPNASGMSPRCPLLGVVREVSNTFFLTFFAK